MLSFVRLFSFSLNQRIRAWLEDRTISRTCQLRGQAKAKNLSFEAKAKDFKMCPRGRPRDQGRPQILHL